ncbi:NAD(P)/FAD-dependent oxidoreductase [Marinobacterium arenosum]|uniref:NAD(P)/FAD-dependent oxidoreductase n=1 Tax=Marinobacterium arenosum TaxID=2862496 RepID=UPI001C97D28C|nr:FAD-binding oxidoreductase [Marinobacterium arenosum]MBY4677740.1 FAD-binding oxidoreductase [Marinobacterium arenosum]
MDRQQAPDITVLGAGIIGISCAVQLQAKGLKVAVIDRVAPGDATSHGNAGVFAVCGCIPVATPGFLWTVPKLLLDPHGPLSLPAGYLPQLAGWGTRFALNTRMKRFEHISSALNPLLQNATELHLAQARMAGADAYAKASPYFYLYKDEAAFQNDKLAWQRRRHFGIEYDILRGDEIRQREASISPEFNYVVALKHHGFSPNPGKLVKALADHFVRQGGEFITGEVVKFNFRDNQPSEVVTDRGIYPLDKVVLAGGAWSAKLAAQLGHEVPLESERGYHIELPKPGIELATPIMFSAGKLVATPMENGIRFAGLVEFGGLKADPNYDFCDRLLHHAKTLFPGINTEDPIKWMGHRPSITDSLPVIGQCPRHANVYYAFGHQHMGLTMAPRTGRIISDLVTSGQSDIDLSPYRIDRF